MHAHNVETHDIPEVSQKKAERRIFSTLRAKSDTFLTSLNRASIHRRE